MIYFCRDARRRELVRAEGVLNGIDFLEVLDGEAPPDSPRQRTLLVRCLRPAPALGAANTRIEGGVRVSPVLVTWAHPAPAVPPALLTPGEQAYLAALPEPDHVLVVRTDSCGDFSTYRLVLTDPAFDPRLTWVEFSFKAECPSDFDCAPRRRCPLEPGPEPEIDYLAKDYASLRRLMLDRISALVPGWRDRNPADLGVTLVELLAHVGDHLSYQQDAVATEAYLGTARRRVSVRRHARLVDYHLHDGASARTWIVVEVSADTASLPRGTRLLTRMPGQPARVGDDPALLGQAEAVFETVHDSGDLPVAHKTLRFHTWSDHECCLPKGATRATLLGHHPTLAPGHVLILEEVRGPLTGQAEDADPARRHAVRLVAVTPADPDAAPLRDPRTGEAVTEVRWHEGDALPFALTICARTDEAHGARLVEDVSVARGNVVLADHGLTQPDEPLGAVPEGPGTPRFRPALAARPVTQVAPYVSEGAATEAWHPHRRALLPAITLQGQRGIETTTWRPRRDLLASGADATEFVTEVEEDDTAVLRFGDDRHGRRPEAGTTFVARYRVGTGARGNVGADTLVHVVTAVPTVVAVRNPLPAVGGLDPETMDEARRRAPVAFRVQERAVTPADWAEVAQRKAGVDRAAATFRWTGSWQTVFVTADRTGGRAVDQAFEADLRAHLERYRLAGYDLEVDGPRWVALEVEMQVCVRPDFFRSHVGAAVLEAVRAAFHPDRQTFGQPVYLSRLYAIAQAVAGVESVHIPVFQRLGIPDRRPFFRGVLPLGRLEIARLDNDPNFPEHGVLRLVLGGGK